MRVEPKSSPVLPGAAAPQRRAAGGPAFTLDGAGGSARTAATRSAAPLATLDALVALQGAGDPTERRRRSVKRGHELLDTLDRLKAALLAGRLAPAELRGLAARLAERHEASGDPGLDEVLAHIELRARVELAKLGAP